LILDDHPEHYKDVVPKLQDAGLDVIILSTFSSIIECKVKDGEEEKEMPNVIGNSHIALVDMQWEKKAIGQFEEGSDYLPTDKELPPTCEGAATAATRKQWLPAVSRWMFSKPVRSRREWPRQPIEEEHVGAWIGALLSWIAPNTQLLFFSGFEKIFESGIQAALSQFQDPPFRVIPKTQNASDGQVFLEIKDLEGALRIQQERLLGDRDIFEWFFSSVVIPALAGKEPEEKECSVFYWGSGAPETRRLKFDYFFPNLREFDKTELWKHLRDYLSRPTLSQNDVKNINLVSHAIKDRATITSADLKRARHYAVLANIWGEEIVSQIDTIISRVKKEKSDSIDAFDNDAIRRIRDLCVAFSGDPTGAFKNLSDKEKWQVDFSGWNQAKSGFTWCPISWFGDMLEHMSANSEGLTPPKPWKATIKHEGRHLRFRFESIWEGNLDSKLFWKTVEESACALGKGMDRGLPLVVRRALESGADACLLRAGEDETWLYGKVEGNCSGSVLDADGTRFEISLFFRTEDKP